MFLPDTTRYFKLLPYTDKYTAQLEDAQELQVDFVGRALSSMMPINFEVNGTSIDPTYTGDIVLTWSPRLRGAGAGEDIGMEGGEGVEEWEGYFEIEIYVSDILVRLLTGIDSVIWTYTEELNLEDNGSLAQTIVFKLRNCIEEATGVYCSEQIEVTVEKE